MAISSRDIKVWPFIPSGKPKHFDCKSSTTEEELSAMKTPQEKAAELLPFVQALANGENVTQSIDGGVELPSNGSFVYGLTYSIKPKMMLVNGFEVPEPIRDKPVSGSTYYCPALNVDIFFLDDEWRESHLCTRRLSRGLIHSNKEAAIAHAKAMLGINPYE